jgi:hypothetical protein
MLANVSNTLLKPNNDETVDEILDYVNTLEEYILENMPDDEDSLEHGFSLKREDGTEIGIGLVLTYDMGDYEQDY